MAVSRGIGGLPDIIGKTRACLTYGSPFRLVRDKPAVAFSIRVQYNERSPLNRNFNGYESKWIKLDNRSRDKGLFYGQ